MNGPIELLRLPARHYNALLAHGIETVEALCALTPDQVLKMHGVGQVALAQIRHALASRGLSLSSPSSK